MSSNTLTESAISSFTIFADLAPAEMRAILPLFKAVKYQPKQHIIFASQNSRDVYFIVQGCVRACAYSDNGKQIHFEDLHAGMMFGELSAIDAMDRSSDCIALQESMVASLSAEKFLQVVNEYPSVCRAVLLRLSGIARRQMQKVYEFSTYNVSQRIQFELVRIASTADISATDIVIEHAPTHAEIASRVSTHREAVTRELKRLEAAGVITWRPGSYVIHDICKLGEPAATPLEPVLSQSRP